MCRPVCRWRWSCVSALGPDVESLISAAMACCVHVNESPTPSSLIGQARRVLGRATWKRRWLLRFSREHLPALARHAATPATARKIRLLAVVWPLTSGFVPRMSVKISLVEGEFMVSDISELLVLFEVFAGDAYPASAVPEHASMIVDAGANIGATLRLFRSRFPEARIVALEPDPDAYDLCRRNSSGDRDLDLRRVALTAAGGEITLGASAARVGRRLSSVAVPGSPWRPRRSTRSSTSSATSTC
jgi:hypothetical protein